MSHTLLASPGQRPALTAPEAQPGDPRQFHRSLPGYAATPLFRLPALASRLGVGEIVLKDESERLGLPAFKMLGASWATARAIQRAWTGAEVPLDLEQLRAALGPGRSRRLVAATDGNHGRGVARMAALMGLESRIYVPAGLAPARIEAIRGEGATVRVVNGSYDDAVRASAQDAGPDCLVISDTSWPGYVDVPADVMHGYSTLFREVDDALRVPGCSKPTHVFLQAGVGSFAASGFLHYQPSPGSSAPRRIVVEPASANCLFRSAEAGEVTEAPGPHRSAMAGLNCGLPSLLAWPVVHALADAYVSIDDDCAFDAMRLLAGCGIVSGESGAAGLGALMALAGDEPGRESLGLDSDAVVLVVNTEGATDPANYERQVGESVGATEVAATDRRSSQKVEVLS